MNEQFFMLPPEKQQRILNAAMQVFAQHEYKRASTDDIAAKAEISKGLLFYYFHNKKTLYLYVLEAVEKNMKAQITDTAFAQITDFFELLEDAAHKKMKMISEMPYIMDFVMRAYYSQGEDVSDTVQQKSQEIRSGTYTQYFSHVDFSKFKPGINPQQVLEMLTWMTEGYCYEKRNQGAPLSLEILMEDFRRWVAMFQQMVYKEEFLQ